jgi:two-component system NtrC family sensor kinase
MPLMQWSEHFVTGIALVDEQHRRLVDLINAAAPQLAADSGDDRALAADSGDDRALAADGGEDRALAADNGKEQAGAAPLLETRPLLDSLVKYAQMHFRCEEEIMRAAAIDPGYFARHQRLHSLFADEVQQMIQDAAAGNKVSGSRLLRFLTSWMSFHILSEDQCMARQLRAIEAGTPAAQAAQAAQVELAAAGDNAPANAVLNNALIDLFSLVSERNRNLKTLNQQLLQAQAELAEANDKLETRVSERTRQLERMNCELGREHDALTASLAEIQRTQTHLVHAEKMVAVGQLAAGVAHEINNPIGFVSSNLGTLNRYTERLFQLIDAYQHLESALPAEHPARSALAQAREQADLDYLRRDIPELLLESSSGLSRVKRIVSDLKDFSRIDESDWQDADLNNGLGSTLNLIWNELSSKAEVIRDFGPLPPVHCIPAQLNQVFMNLLLNAAQAISSAGLITLRTRLAGQAVRITIADNGPGIPEAIQQRIFDPFFTTKAVGQGTGLGLSVAWDIIKMHAGRIEVESAPGCGTTFTITLPINPAHPLTPTD